MSKNTCCTGSTNPNVADLTQNNCNIIGSLYDWQYF